MTYPDKHSRRNFHLYVIGYLVVGLVHIFNKQIPKYEYVLGALYLAMFFFAIIFMIAERRERFSTRVSLS